MQIIGISINEWRNALFDSELSPSVKLVGLAIARYWRPDKLCYPSISTLMADCSIKSKHTIISAIKELSDTGFIKVKKGQIKYLSSLQNYYELSGVDNGATDSAFDGAINGAGNGAINGAINGAGNGAIIAPEIREEENIGNLKKDNLKVIQKKIFQKPSLDEVRAYCLERQNNVDAEKWFDFYTSNGWKVGKNSMKDWRAAVRTWEKSPLASGGSKTQETTWQRNMRIMREIELENQMEANNG